MPLNTEPTIFCFHCGKCTEHIPKLSLSLEGKQLCTKCNRPNGIYTLLKVNETGFIETASQVRWVEWEGTEIGSKAKKLYKKPKVGRSLILSPIGYGFTWLTTPVKEIIDTKENCILFRTRNTDYLLYHPINKKIIKEKRIK